MGSEPSQEPSDREFQEAVDLVTSAYDAGCRRGSCAVHGWLPGRLAPEELTLYVAVNACERVSMSGFPELLDDRRFSLAQAAEALEIMGLPEAAAAIRFGAEAFSGGIEPADVDERHELFELACDRKPGLLERVNERFFTTSDSQFYARASRYIREHRAAFHQPEAEA